LGCVTWGLGVHSNCVLDGIVYIIGSQEWIDTAHFSVCSHFCFDAGWQEKESAHWTCREQARKKRRTGDCESFGCGFERFSAVYKYGAALDGLLLHLGTLRRLGI
jgi:hypothetical protein